MIKLLKALFEILWFRLFRLLFLTVFLASCYSDSSEIHLNIPADEFVSKKITNKLVQQIQVSFVENLPKAQVGDCS